MGMRCYDVLDIPFLTNIILAGGKSGLNHSIFWVHLAESTENEKELFSLLKPDDFVMIKGPFLGKAQACLLHIMEKAVELKLAGILLFKSIYCHEIPEQMIKMADENEIPLFWLNQTSSMAIEIQYYMVRMIMNNENSQNNLFEKIIKDIYYGTVEDEKLRMKRSYYMGYNLQQKHIGVSVAVLSENGKYISLDQAIADVFQAVFEGYAGKEILALVQAHSLICLLPFDADEERKFPNVCEKAIKKIKQRYPDVYIVIGIGQEKENVNCFKESICEAEKIVEVMRRRKQYDQVRIYHEMYTFLLLYQVRREPNAALLCQKLFNPLWEYDKHYGSNLFGVLKIYFEEGRNTVQTAKKMFMHRNTLLYQLNKIEELTGLDLKNSDDEFECRMGYYLLEIMDRK